MNEPRSIVAQPFRLMRQPTASAAAKTPVSALNFEYDRMQKDFKFFPNIVAKLNFNISAIPGERLADVLDAK
jgi:hypothetical protein